MYHYAGNNPVKYTDPDGAFIKSKFFLSIAQVAGGTLEIIAGCTSAVATCGTSSVASVYAVVDGVYNITDGIIGASTACSDRTYDGAIPEVSKKIAAKSGAKKETQDLVGAAAGLIDSVCDLKATGGLEIAKSVKNAVKVGKVCDKASSAISAAQLTSASISVGKPALRKIKKASDHLADTLYENMSPERIIANSGKREDNW